MAPVPVPLPALELPALVTPLALVALLALRLSVLLYWL
jgi:hypothetical protein